MEYKWRALGVVCIGSLMGAIDSSVLIIAFPDIASDLQASLAEMVWVIMIYILMGTALVLSLGRIADMKGRKRLYMAGFVVFILGSALSGLSQSGWELVAARAVQGVGGAMLLANSFAIISDAFPSNERGRAFGLNSVVWGGGAIVGVLLGAAILTFASWRWIFWINVPIGVGATLAAYWVLRESVTPNPKETFDLPASLMFTGALALFLLGITEGILLNWSDPAALIPLLLTIPLLLGFVVWEIRVSRDPILPFGLFKNWLFSASLLTSVLQGIAIFAANFLLMIYFIGIRGIAPLTAALLLVPLSVALAIVGPFGGRLSDRYGARVISTVGLLIQAGGLFGFASISASTSLAAVAAIEATMGVGAGLFFPANTSAVMAGVPRNRYGVGSGAMMTFRNSAMALSFAVALIALTSQLPGGTGAIIFGGSFSQLPILLHMTVAQVGAVFLNGMHTAFEVSAGLVLVAAVFSALRGKQVQAPAEAPASVVAANAPVPSERGGARPASGELGGTSSAADGAPVLAR